jgi:hypothetical protein
MTPSITTNQLDILNKEFYENTNIFGRDKLYFLIKDRYDDKAPSRRQVAEWLAKQVINQIFRPSKRKAKDIQTNITSPNTILAIDLMNMESFK